MSSVIIFSALINHVTNENRFYERHETACDMSPKKSPEHARKNCKVLRVVHREGEFFTIPT